MESAFDLLPLWVWIGLIVILLVGIIAIFFINRSRNKEVDDLQNAFNHPYHMTVDDEEDGMEEEVHKDHETSEPTGFTETETSEGTQEMSSKARSRFRRGKGNPADDQE